MKIISTAILSCFAALTLCAAPKGGGDAIAQLLNSRSAGSPKAFEEAAEVVAAEAREGKILQQFLVAVLSREQGAPKCLQIDEETRKEYFANSSKRIEALAERKSNALAWYLLSLEKNDVRLLKKAADAGNVQALNNWGTITLTQALANPGVETNDVEMILHSSFKAFETAAGKGDSNGLYNLGMCYMEGYGCLRDPEKAFTHFKASAELGHPEAINNLGAFYRDGVVVRKDLAEAARQFARSADLGNAYGQLNYALALQRGEGLPRDSERAARLFRDAAEKGNLEAVNAYAMCLFAGDGVKKDVRLAVRWYTVAAERGLSAAMENLAACYEAGLGGLERSERKALLWKMRARAARGDRNAAAWVMQNSEGKP